jgi:protoheme IX farnesyltransferase
VFKEYYQLAKPGIIYGNAVTAIGGYFLATRGHFNLVTFLGMLVGISLVIGSACVFNNYIDRDIDQRMARTKKRALVSGSISTTSALTYGTVLGVIGALVLFFTTNTLTLVVGLFGVIMYVAVYGYAKRASVHGTLVGSVAGAVPIVVGYTSVSNQLDAPAWILFTILVTWQMPHFFAIAMYRLKDYQAASIPVLPSIRGMHVTKLYILGYITAFIVACASLTLFGYAGYTYLVVMVLTGLIWLWFGLKSFKSLTDPLWGRTVFRISLVSILVVSLMVAVGPILP